MPEKRLRANGNEAYGTQSQKKVPTRVADVSDENEKGEVKLMVYLFG